MPVEAFFFLGFTIGERREIVSTNFLLAGTGGGGGETPVTVPTTGQIYPRVINI